MSLPTLATQAWRVIRVGGVAALAATQAAPHVSTSGSKAALIAGIVAFVESAYRTAVPAKEQTLLAKYWTAVKLVVASPAVSALVSEAGGQKLVADVAAKQAEVNAVLIDPSKPS
jgi:hypothetical protein